MTYKFTNFARAKIATPPSGTGGLSFTVEPGKGALFPSPSGGDTFFVCFKNATKTLQEIVEVSARSTDLFTIVSGGRGKDGTTARTWTANDYVELILNKAALENFAQKDEGPKFSVGIIVRGGPIIVGGSTSVGTSTLQNIVDDLHSSGGGDVVINGNVNIATTFVPRSNVNIGFRGGTKLVWTGDPAGICVATPIDDVIRDVIWNGLHIDVGAGFSGTALKIRSGQNINANVIRLQMTGTASKAVHLCAESNAGGDYWAKQNLTGLKIGQIVQLGTCGTCLHSSGLATSTYGPGPQAVTLNTIDQIVARDCRQYGIDLHDWTDSNNFPGMHVLAINADNAVGLQVGGTDAVANAGVYNNQFGTVAPDAFGTYVNRIGVRLQRSKLTRIFALYANPAPEGGRFVADEYAYSYDVMEMLDDAALPYPNNIVHHQRGVTANPANGGISTEQVAISDDSVAAWSVNNPNDPGANICVIVAVNNSASPNGNGIVRAKIRRAAGPPECSKVAGDSFLDTTTGALAGTTGSDNKLTVSAHTDGKLYIENRLGFTVYIALSFLSRIQI